MLSIDPGNKALMGVLNLYTGVKRYDSESTPRIGGTRIALFLRFKNMNRMTECNLGRFHDGLGKCWMGMHCQR
jgi:hypothetical protein